MILGNVTINSNKTFFCTNDYGYALSVVMWATFNGIKGNNSIAEPLQTTIRATTTTTLATFSTTRKGKIPMKIVEIKEKGNSN